MLHNHNINPIYNKNSKVLILGSFPSVKSREAQFYYYHPQNRFWKIIENLYHESLTTIDEKKNFLFLHHIALWDVIESCEIKGSSDCSIENVKVNDIVFILKNSQIKTIYTNGKKAHQLYQRYCLPHTHIEDICLPSSSPANATYSLDQLIEEYKIIQDNT